MVIREPKLVDLIRSLYSAQGFSLFETGAYNLNLFGIRQAQGVDLFNDVLGCVYRAAPEAPQAVELWPGTTDPGAWHLRQPGARGGAAIVCPGQYRGVWSLGLHKGRDPAFVQVGPITVYRDNDRDVELDMAQASRQTGLFGINGHRAGEDSPRVDRWSAGCQVWKRRADHDRALELGRAQLAAHPTWRTFTYTLFEASAASEPLFAALGLTAPTPAP